MRATYYTLFLFASIVIVTSCSKSGPANTNQPSGCSLESLSEVYNGTTTSAFYYTYDNPGRVTRIDFGTRQSATYETYTYSADKIVVSGTALGNGTAVYELDASGKVIKYGTTTFTYNSNGYLAKSTEVNGPHTTTITYTYQNGNLVRVDQVGNYGGPQPVVTVVLFEYEQSPAIRSIPPGDPINNFGSSRSVLGAWFGKGSTNLVKRETAMNNTSADEIRTHTYTRDSKGNIVNVRTDVSDGRVGEKRLTYNCN